MSRLEEARDRFAGDWADLRESMRKETGRRPQWAAGLVWPALALAVGVAVGAGFWRRRSGQKD